jgi:hypothetical protein
LYCISYLSGDEHKYDKGNEFYNKRYDVIFIAADAEIEIEIHLYLL